MINSRDARNQAANEGSPESPSSLIDTRIRKLDDWRGQTLARIRALIKQADPEVVEQVKWRKPSNPAGVPVWFHGGIICTGESYKDKVKLTFPNGVALKDPSGLFNSGLQGKSRRAIDIREGDEIDEESFKMLVRAAVVLNTSGVGSERGQGSGRHRSRRRSRVNRNALKT